MKLLKETRPFPSIDTFKREQLRGQISEMFSTAGGFCRPKKQTEERCLYETFRFNHHQSGDMIILRWLKNYPSNLSNFKVIS